MRRPAVTVTALGVCTPLGRSVDALWERIAAGRDGFVEVDRFPLPGLPSRWACAFPADVAAALCAEAGHADPAVAFAILAARDAVAHLSEAERAHTILVLATSAGAADTHDAYDRERHDLAALGAEILSGGAFTSFASVLARAVGLGGARTTVSTACASGTHALGLGIDLVRGGARRVLVVGSDAAHPSLFAGFYSVGALADAPCGPFGTRFGMSLGEGAGAILLEPDAPAPLAVLHGWGGSSDAWHPTAPQPQGEGMARSLADALHDAGVSAAQIGAYNAHGTGTEANDAAETCAVRAVLGDGVPVSATKSQLGHAQGAAGLLEAIVTVAALRAQAVPPALRSEPRRRLAPAGLASDRASPAAYDVAMSHSAAFGGTNATIVIGRTASAAERPPPEPIFARGRGVLGPFGGAAGRVVDPASPAVPLAEPRVRPARADRITSLLTAAVAAASTEAGLDTATSPADRVGMVVGMADGPQQSIRDFVDSRDQRGLDRASATAFARMVFNAPAGGASTALQLRGTNLTLWSGHGAGAQAIAAAARLLREHTTLEAVVAAAADEDGYIAHDRRDLDTLPGRPIEAAAAIVLGRQPADARLAGWAEGAAEHWPQVVARALGSERPDRAITTTARGLVLDLDVPWQARLDDLVGHAPATGAIVASAAAIDWIRGGVAMRVLVVAVSADAGATALLWTHPDAKGAP